MNIKLTIKLKIQDVEHEFTVEELRELRDAIGSVLDDSVDAVGEPKMFTPQEMKGLRVWPKRTSSQEWADIKDQIRLYPQLRPNVPTDSEVTEAINNR